MTGFIGMDVTRALIDPRGMSGRGTWVSELMLMDKRFVARWCSICHCTMDLRVVARNNARFYTRISPCTIYAARCHAKNTFHGIVQEAASHGAADRLPTPALFRFVPLDIRNRINLSCVLGFGRRNREISFVRMLCNRINNAAAQICRNILFPFTFGVREILTWYHFRYFHRDYCFIQ